MIYMITTGLVCFLTLLVIEYRVFEGISYYIGSFFERKVPLLAEQNDIEPDVDAEKQRIKQMSMNDLYENNLVLKGLSKYYGKFLAVNQLSIGIQRYLLYKLYNNINVVYKSSTISSCAQIRMLWFARC